jgi:hypothetical protein
LAISFKLPIHQQKGVISMNLKTWFKGLAVFVASSLITSLAAANLSPSTFNFSKEGLMKLGALAAIVGMKAVLLYLKQSPLPSSGNPTDWSKVSGAIAFALALPAALMVSGCVNSWEQSTYATLATGKALIDCAVAGYNHYDADIRHVCAAAPDDPSFNPSRFYIAQTHDAQQAIEKARQAQIASVEAFEAYAVAKVSHDKTVSLADKTAAVTAYLAQLPTLLNAVRVLMGADPVTASPHGPGAALNWPSPPARRMDPAGAIRRLNPMASFLRSADHQIPRRCPLASNPVFTNSPAAAAVTSSRASQIVGTVTAVATEIEQLIAASGAGSALNVGVIEQLTILFGNLAGVAIQAFHEVAGKAVTPESVLALMPGTTPLADPPDAAAPAAGA